MDIYRELILDHYKHPRNFGHLENPDVTQEEGNVTCGDKISMEVQLSTVNSQLSIRDVRFWGEGCAISQASASMLTEKVIGMSIKNIMKLATEDILKMLGTSLAPSRIKCAMLSLEVLQKAIITYGR